jgi:uncharacterized protein
MSFTTLEQIFRVLFASPFVGEKVPCVWHASEPLVLPISFYRQAFEIQNRWNTTGARVTNAFQTNATLITQQWCDFFREHEVQIGVSIDGPRALHDAHRVDRKDRGTFDRAMKGIELLRANNIPFSAIAVITSDTIQHPDEFWHFFHELQPIRLGLNPEEVEGCNSHSSLHSEEGIAQYKQFLQRLLTLNTQSQSFLSIREFDVLLQRIQVGQEMDQADTNTPLAILNFDLEGNISTFSPEMLSITHPIYDKITFGNVFTHSLEDIFTHTKFTRVNTLIQQGVARCKESCQYFALCGGGTPSNKLYETGAFNTTETNACRLHIKAVTDTLLEYLEESYALSPGP